MKKYLNFILNSLNFNIIFTLVEFEEKLPGLDFSKIFKTELFLFIESMNSMSIYEVIVL